MDGCYKMFSWDYDPGENQHGCIRLLWVCHPVVLSTDVTWSLVEDIR